MITFTMLVTIWMGHTTHSFHVYSTQRFSGSAACERAMENTATKIRTRINKLPKGTRAEIARSCEVLVTRPA